MCSTLLRVIAAIHALASVSRGSMVQLASISAAAPAANNTGPEKFQILHISKTGGTALFNALTKHAKDSKVGFQGHMEAHYLMSTFSTPTHSVGIVFFVRAPVHRFTAGWLSRYRKGAPAHYAPWSDREKTAFKDFASPDELACALSARDPHKKREAEQTMKFLQHVSWSMSWFLGGLPKVKQALSSNSIIFVGRTEHFQNDYESLVKLLDQSGGFKSQPPSKPPRIHVNPENLDALKVLSKCAVENLHEWYKDDYEIIDHLAEHGPLDSAYPEEVAKLDRAPADGEKRSFLTTPL